MVRDEILELPAVQIDQQWYDVSLQTWHDGTRYAGRLWFEGAGTERDGMPGRRLFSGSSRDEVIDRVQEMSPDEMRGQFRHAMTDRRRYLPLRALIDEMLQNVRNYNLLAVELRTGATEPKSARAELDSIQARLHELVDGMQKVAGVEGVVE